MTGIFLSGSRPICIELRNRKNAKKRAAQRGGPSGITLEGSETGGGDVSTKRDLAPLCPMRPTGVYQVEPAIPVLPTPRRPGGQWHLEPLNRALILARG